MWERYRRRWVGAADGWEAVVGAGMREELDVVVGMGDVSGDLLLRGRGVEALDLGLLCYSRNSTLRVARPNDAH